MLEFAAIRNKGGKGPFLFRNSAIFQVLSHKWRFGGRGAKRANPQRSREPVQMTDAFVPRSIRPSVIALLLASSPLIKWGLRFRSLSCKQIPGRKFNRVSADVTHRYGSLGGRVKHMKQVLFNSQIVIRHIVSEHARNICCLIIFFVIHGLLRTY